MWPYVLISALQSAWAKLHSLHAMLSACWPIAICTLVGPLVMLLASGRVANFSRFMFRAVWRAGYGEEQQDSAI